MGRPVREPRTGLPGAAVDFFFRSDRLPTSIIVARQTMTTAAAPAPRVLPLQPPYPPGLQAMFDQVMPPGVPPLALFTTLARTPRVYERFRAASLIDRGPLPLRLREIMIDRTCARCGCAYEWGVHIAFFAERVKLTPAEIAATVHGDADDPAWSGEEKLLIRLADELHDSAGVSDALWAALAAAFSVEQIMELIALAGFYHTVSFFANGLKVPPEPFAAAFPPR